MDQMPKVQIYHNPACGTSRNTLALIRNAGIEPEVIEYLVTPPSRDELIQLISDAGLSVRDALRKNVDPYTELNLDDAGWSDEKLLDAMLQHPILINPRWWLPSLEPDYAAHRKWYWIFCLRHN